MRYRRTTRKLLCKLLLAATIVAAQITVAGHADFDGHSADATCVICASSSTLSAGDAARIESLSPVSQTAAAVPERLFRVVEIFPVARSARAPPVYS